MTDLRKLIVDDIEIEVDPALTLLQACEEAGVSVLWGLELMIELVQSRQLGAKAALEIAQGIRSTNPFITEEIVELGPSPYA